MIREYLTECRTENPRVGGSIPPLGLKTPYANGKTHVIFEPLDFIARLVALVPRPRVNLTRYHGIFAPHSEYRALVTPAMGGRKKSESDGNQTPAERRVAMKLT